MTDDDRPRPEIETQVAFNGDPANEPLGIALLTMAAGLLSLGIYGLVVVLG